MIVKENKIISDYAAVKKSLTGVSDRIKIGQKGTSTDERRANINIVKGLMKSGFIKIPKNKSGPVIYGNHTAIDVESIIRRSEIELGNYELKQGLLLLNPAGGFDPGMIDKIAKTICAIANNGPNSNGKVLIGIADKESDARRVKEIDGIDANKIGSRFVVGVSREAKRAKLSKERYVSHLKEGIRKSGLSPRLRDDVLSNLDFN